MATLVWKGYTWDLYDAGVTTLGFNEWSSANVSVDSNGYLNLAITNPTGVQPIGCAMAISTLGMGYGTYKIVVGTDLTTLDKNIVFGGLYLYNSDTFIEFDACESSQWDGEYANTQINHQSWYGTEASPIAQLEHINIPSDAVQTHFLIWRKDMVIFKSFVGNVDLNAQNPYFETVFTENIPEPDTERVKMNLWTYCTGAAGADDLDAPATTVIVRDFEFIPENKYSAGTSMIRGVSHG